LGRNRDGTPCSAAPRASGWCLWHDPAREADRAAWRKRGGERRSNAARAKRQLPAERLSLRQVQAVLCRALTRVEAGELAAGPANSLANLARAIAAVAEAGDLEERVAAMEGRAAAAEGRGRTA
jgi:hypothetical protein